MKEHAQAQLVELNSLPLPVADGIIIHRKIKILEFNPTLAVADSGVGLPPEPDFRETNSLGLQLVSTLVDQLAGIVEMDRNRETNFKIMFTLF